MKDIECLKEALTELNVTFTQRRNGLLLSNGIELTNIGDNIKLSLEAHDYTDDLRFNQFVEKLNKTYVNKLEEKLKRIRIEEAKLKEEALFDQLKEIQLRRERMRLEMIKKREEDELKKKVEETTTKIRERAKKLGYEIKEQVKGKERILVLVRRI